MPFPGPGGKWQVSANGSWTFPAWSRDGGELYYEDPSDVAQGAAIRIKGNEFTVVDRRPILPGLQTAAAGLDFQCGARGQVPGWRQEVQFWQMRQARCCSD